MRRDGVLVGVRGLPQRDLPGQLDLPALPRQLHPLRLRGQLDRLPPHLQPHGRPLPLRLRRSALLRLRLALLPRLRLLHRQLHHLRRERQLAQRGRVPGLQREPLPIKLCLLALPGHLLGLHLPGRLHKLHQQLRDHQRGLRLQRDGADVRGRGPLLDLRIFRHELHLLHGCGPLRGDLRGLRRRDLPKLLLQHLRVLLPLLLPLHSVRLHPVRLPHLLHQRY